MKFGAKFDEIQRLAKQLYLQTGGTSNCMEFGTSIVRHVNNFEAYVTMEERCDVVQYMEDKNTCFLYGRGNTLSAALDDLLNNMRAEYDTSAVNTLIQIEAVKMDIATKKAELAALEEELLALS